MKRLPKIVLKAPKGLCYNISHDNRGVLNLELVPETVYSGDYTNPPIPKGWEHVEGDWNTGFVIQDSKGNQFVWVPVGFLDSNGTMDGINFSEKFGRRNYLGDIKPFHYATPGFYEAILEEQFTSVKKYGGFYISRYNISKNKKKGEYQSVKDAIPLHHLKYDDAMGAGWSFGSKEDGIISHLVFGEEYDSVLEWFIKSRARSFSEIAIDSSIWGNMEIPSGYVITKTGSNEEWCTNNIYDFAGNVSEWTMEQYWPIICIRGGNYRLGKNFPVSYRIHGDSVNIFDYAGCRSALLIK